MPGDEWSIPLPQLPEMDETCMLCPVVIGGHQAIPHPAGKSTLPSPCSCSFRRLSTLPCMVAVHSVG